MNTTDPPDRNNLNEWLSEHPKQREYITHPLRVWYFLTHPPPRPGEDDEWNRILQAIEGSTGTESSTGTLWPDYLPEPNPEPPF